MTSLSFEYSTRYISGPTAEPVTLDEILKHLKLDDGNAYDQNDLLRKAKAARRIAEGALGKLIGAQVWDIVSDFWPGWNWRIPIEPVNSVTGIYWTDINGAETTVDPQTFVFSSAQNRLWLRPNYYWPNGYLAEFAAVRIRVNVGITNIPETIKQAILVKLGTLDQFREDTTAGTVLQAASVGTFEALLGVERNIGI